MKNITMKLCLIAFAAWNGGLAFGFDNTHARWTDVLAKYQEANGRVHYAKLKADMAGNANHPLELYLKDISSVKKAEFDGWKREDQMAFLINAYNALTFKLIVMNYPVKSIKDIGSLFKSPWKKEFFSLLDGTLKTLDPIEHEYLRKKYKDYRIHAAVNCASISCPRLQHVAFVGSKLDSQLESAFKAFVNDAERNDLSNPDTLMLSKIFDWFKDDFEKDGGRLKVIAKYGPASLKTIVEKEPKVKFLNYNWGLNEAKDGATNAPGK